nr:MAG TPA: hypothetical protein [Caudoviricetes sp.]
MKIGVIYLSENGLKSVTKSVTKFAVFEIVIFVTFPNVLKCSKMG